MSPSGSCRIVPEAESLIRSRGENTPLASSTSFRRASARAVPGRGQPRRFIILTRMGGCRTASWDGDCAGSYSKPIAPKELFFVSFLPWL